VHNKQKQLAFLLFIILSYPIFAREKPVTSLLEIRQKNVSIQQWDLSCGAATLTTLLKYQHGIDTDEKTVAKGLINRKEYIDDPKLLKYRKGFSLLDLTLYTKKIGLQGKGHAKLAFNDLLRLAPILIPINEGSYNHFVIFRGQMNNRVLIADPAWGNRTLPIDNFNKVWINYPKFGHIGFTVTQPSENAKNTHAINQLEIKAADFPMLY
jgi:predicted double-glycine peptidase